MVSLKTSCFGRVCIDKESDVDLLCVASLTSATAAAGAVAGSTGLAGSAGIGVVSVFAGSGAVAGAGAAGVVSVGFASAFAGAAVSEVAVAAGSSFFDLLLLPLKRPLKAFFIWSMASSASGNASGGLSEETTVIARGK